MRQSISMLAAAVIAVTGAMSFAPAQAAMRAAPAVLDESAAKAGIVQVHRKHRRVRRGHHHHGYVYVPHYPRYVRRHYRPYAYYPHHYYGRPGVSLQFSFGGGHGGWGGW